MIDRHRIDKLLSAARDQATPRALAGLALLVIFLAYVIGSSLASELTKRSDRLAELTREIAIRSAIAEENDWPQRAERLEAIRSEMRSGFWRGETEGLIAAQLQTVIEDAIRRAGLGEARVVVPPTPTPLAGDDVLFEINVTGLDRNGDVLGFLRYISEAEALIAPVALEWRRRNARFTVRLIAPGIVDRDDGDLQ